MFEEYLRQIEQENIVTILYCCESGARAWQFPSPDSDYDIRFVYVHLLQWYVSLTSGRDTMEWFSDDRLLDFSGWDLRKTLNLFAVCNPAFNEQLGSPIIYRENTALSSAIRELIPKFFLPIRAFHHYFSIADKMQIIHPFEDSIGVKAYFYIIRPLLACRFILEHQVQPPTSFADLLEQIELPQEIKNQLIELVERKKNTKEKTLIEIPDTLIQYTSKLHEEMQALHLGGVNNLLPAGSEADRSQLETLFQQFTLHFAGK